MALNRKGRKTQASRQPPAQRHAGSPANTARRTTALHMSLLSAVSLALYAAALPSDFVSDDTQQLLQNPFITNYRYIPRLFATHVWAFAQLPRGNYYRPLQMLVYMAEYYAFGFYPWPFHLVNLLVGIAAVMAVYFLTRALANSSLALWTALLFALHPVHSEPVVWIAALPDLLCGLSLFTAMIFYHRARTGTRPLLNHATATAIFFAGLFCKEPAMVFPALLLAYEFFYRQESLRNILFGWRRLLPYAAALAVYIAFRLRVLGAFAPAKGAMNRLTLRQNFLSVPVLVGQYVLKLLWPVNLNYFYQFTPENAIGWKFIVSVLLIGALLGAMFWLRRAQPLLSFAVAWFFCTLAPVLSIENVSASVFAERYLFAPSLGFCIWASWAWLRMQRDWPRRLALGVAYPGLALVLAFWIVQIERRIPDWRNDLQLLQKTAVQSPNLPIIQGGLGVAYYNAGKFELAIPPLERSLALGYGGYDTHLFLSLSMAGLGEYQAANDELRLAYELKPPDEQAWSAFGLAHASLRQWDRAVDCYRKATETDPQNQLMFELLGEALQQEGDMPGAIAAWRQALQLQPGYLDPSINLAITLAQEQKTDEAIGILTTALQAHPKETHSADGYANLGTIYMHRGELDAAEAAYEHALDLNPDLTFARQAIASIDAIRRRVQ